MAKLVKCRVQPLNAFQFFVDDYVIPAVLAFVIAVHEQGHLFNDDLEFLAGPPEFGLGDRPRVELRENFSDPCERKVFHNGFRTADSGIRLLLFELFALQVLSKIVLCFANGK